MPKVSNVVKYDDRVFTPDDFEESIEIDRCRACDEPNAKVSLNYDAGEPRCRKCVARIKKHADKPKSKWRTRDRSLEEKRAVGNWRQRFKRNQCSKAERDAQIAEIDRVSRARFDQERSPNVRIDPRLIATADNDNVADGLPRKRLATISDPASFREGLKGLNDNQRSEVYDAWMEFMPTWSEAQKAEREADEPDAA